MKPAIEVRGLGKVYNINHEMQAQTGTATVRDAMTRALKKPLNLLTGGGMDQEKFWALDDINFEVAQGDVVGIVGRNGSGKSTLPKILSRIVEPTAGEIILRGKVASLLEVGTGFHPELTGRENVYFNGAILGMSQQEIRSKFKAIVEFSEIEKFLDTPVKFYSSGMYVRLAFSVAAHLDPDVLIVDEVLAVGDAQFQKKCLGKMGEVAGEGRTVLFVSHSMASVKALCNKGIYLEKGKIVTTGDIESVATSYVESAYRTEGSQDLRERPRNQGLSSEAQIISLSLKNAGHKTTDTTLSSTEPLEIEMVVDSPTGLTEPVVAHIIIQDASGIVLRLHSEYTNTLFKLKKGKNVIKCLVDPTALLGGAYAVDCSILFPGREPHHIDMVEDASLLLISEYKVPSGNQLLTQRDATFYAHHTWKESK